MPLSPCLRQFATVAVLASALAAGGCGADGVELNGKLFDMMGVSSAAQNARTRDPQMAERAPLVVPPNVARLPEPGSGKVASEEVASLKDPEQRKLAAAKERERLHLAYCRGDLQWREKAFDPNATNRSPYGPCPSLFGNVTGSVNK